LPASCSIAIEDEVVIGREQAPAIPYVIEHMDPTVGGPVQGLDLPMKPSEYWRRQCYETYQSDRSA